MNYLGLMNEVQKGKEKQPPPDLYLYHSSWVARFSSGNSQLALSQGMPKVKISEFSQSSGYTLDPEFLRADLTNTPWQRTELSGYITSVKLLDAFSIFFWYWASINF